MSDITINPEPVAPPVAIGQQPAPVDATPTKTTAQAAADEKTLYQQKYDAILKAFDKALKDVPYDHAEYGQLKSLRNLVQVQVDRVGVPNAAK